MELQKSEDVFNIYATETESQEQNGAYVVVLVKDASKFNNVMLQNGYNKKDGLFYEEI